MKRNVALCCLGLFLPFAVVPSRAQMPTPVPSFTITAIGITMPSSGTGLIPFTLTSVNGFAGTLNITCTPPNPAAGVREPVCGGGSVTSFALAAKATVTGNASLMAYVYFPPKASSRLDLQRRGEGTSWALAGVLMLGFGLQRRRARRLGYRSGLLLLAVGTLIGLTGISACSAGPETLTPGVYAYTVTATDQNDTSSSVSTTVQVTVPSGIDVQAAPPPI
jgi:hypothetical protein